MAIDEGRYGNELKSAVCGLINGVLQDEEIWSQSLLWPG